MLFFTRWSRTRETACGRPRVFLIEMARNREEAAPHGMQRGSELIATRAVTQRPEGSLDPRVSEVAWVAVRATAARMRSIASDAHLSEALRAMSDVLEHTWDPGRTAAWTRVASQVDDFGRSQLELTLGLGVLGANAEAAEDAERCANVALATLSRFPSPFTIERISPASVLDNWPEHVAQIRQPWIEVADGEATARAPSRFDRQLESWLELAELFVSYPSPLLLHACFMATSLSVEEALRLEHQATVAADILERANEARNAVVSRRAVRVMETLADVSESFSGPLWVGEVLAGCAEPLSRPLVRSIAASISNQCDVLHGFEAAPVVAGRRRIVGGFDIEHLSARSRRELHLGLPRVATSKRVLTDCYSLTEAALCFRWPVPAGRSIPTIPPDGHITIPAPAGLPADGVRLGVDTRGDPVFLPDSAFSSHAIWLGGTGSGKSTGMRSIIRDLLEKGEAFVVLDPHGDLARGVLADANALGRKVALIDADEPRTLALDLAGGIDPRTATADETSRVCNRIVGAAVSHLNPDFAGPVFQAMAGALCRVVFGASGKYILGLGDVARAFVDEELLRWLLSVTDDSHAANVLRKFMAGRESPEAAIWAGSKFDAFTSPAAERIFAPFGEGVSVGQAISAGTPLVINLSAGGLSRIASHLLGHLVLATTVDYALERPPGDRTPFTVWVDEAQRFPGVNLVDALAETRKYGMRLVLATQELSRLDYELRDAALANANMRAIFRCGVADAAFLAPLIGVPAPELASMPNLSACVHLTGHAPFSVRLAPPEPLGDRPEYSPPARLVRRARTKKVAVDVARAREEGHQAAQRERVARRALVAGLVSNDGAAADVNHAG